jgi:4-hydroxy-3-polyprenylbenzoate decarboxylase
MKKRLVVGLTGASGAPIAIKLLKALRNSGEYESHVVYTEGFLKTLALESGSSEKDICALSDRVYDNGAIGSDIASGTFRTEGMVIAPCSMKTLAGIATGYSENLLLRAADVTIKERRKLVLVARESPLSPIHLENMLKLAQMGAVIMPPVLSYYNAPSSIDDMTTHIVGKALEVFGVELPKFKRWGGC